MNKVFAIQNLHINSALKGIDKLVRVDDSYIKTARVGQFDPTTVRIVLELKHSVAPKTFTLDLVVGIKNRLVVDLYLSQPAQASLPGKAGRDRPIIIMIDPGHGGEDPGAHGK